MKILEKVGLGVVVRIGRFPVQTLLGTRPGLGIQPLYEAPGDLCVKNVKHRVSEAVPSITGERWPWGSQIAA